MIDSDGYRANVGIILCNSDSRVFWARRAGQNAWQFPQGGIQLDETPEAAMYRELQEETGLRAEHVEIISTTRPWLRYQLPERYVRWRSQPLCIGQKQIWYMLRLLGDDSCVDLENSEKPEFDEWCWVNYWHPMSEVIFFKRKVYKCVLREFARLVMPSGITPSTAQRTKKSTG